MTDTETQEMMCDVLDSHGYSVHETATGRQYITGWECASDEEWDAAKRDVMAIIGPLGGDAYWVDDDLYIVAERTARKGGRAMSTDFERMGGMA